MGLILCDKHGPHSGPMCCEHINAAVNGHLNIPATTAVRFAIDVLDDGTECLPHIICPDCAHQFGLTSDTTYPSTQWNDDISHLTPTCQHCINEWQART